MRFSAQDRVISAHPLSGGQKRSPLRRLVAVFGVFMAVLLAPFLASPARAADADMAVPIETSAPNPDTAVPDPVLGARVGELSLEFGGRLMTGWEYADERPRNGQPGEDLTEFGFFLRKAIFKVDAEWRERLRMQLDFDVSKNDPLRDAWANYRFTRWFQVRAGLQKRPFSRLELRGASKLPVRERGLGNDLIVSDMGYGERSIGLKLWGKHKPTALDWALSVSNPPPNQPGVDLNARLAWSPVKGIEVGTSAAHKIIENVRTIEEDFIAGQAVGLDVRLKTERLYVLLDAILAEDLRFAERPSAGSLSGYASYDIELSDDWALQPVLFGEWADTDLGFRESEAVRMIAGVNALWLGNAMRIMPQVEVIHPLQPAADTVWIAQEKYYVMLAIEY